MSWFRFAGTSRGGRDNLDLWSQIFSRPRARSRKPGFDRQNCRRLRIDELESRCLLSITPADLSAVIVNQTFGATQTTTAAHSVASDNSGDFVVTWTREDSVLNIAGQPIINPATGSPYEVSDVYARYFTDTVEKITLPAGTTSFSLKDNDQTIEQISITAGSDPTGDPNPVNPDIEGTFTLWYDANGNGTIDTNLVGVDGQPQSELLTVNYSELDPTAAAQQVQTWLNNFLPVTGTSDATHATVNAIDPHTFVVDFGTATQGLDQSSLLQYLSPQSTAPIADSTQTGGTLANTNFTGGFLPAVQVTNLDRPFTIENIPVSTTNPDLTAEAIASYFSPPTTPGDTAVAPINFPTPNEISQANTLAPYSEPVSTNGTVNTTPLPFVEAQPVVSAGGASSATQFDITFTGISGTTVDAPVVVTDTTNAVGAVSYSASLNSEGVAYNAAGAAAYSEILKQTGNEFEVNPPLPTSIYTENIAAANSIEPAVAMDGAGDFIVTWTEQIPQEDRAQGRHQHLLPPLRAHRRHRFLLRRADSGRGLQRRPGLLRSVAEPRFLGRQFERPHGQHRHL